MKKIKQRGFIFIFMIKTITCSLIRAKKCEYECLDVEEERVAIFFGN